MSEEKTTEVRPEKEPLLCDRCGREALGALGDENLCESCYHSSSATCAVDDEQTC